ncbi:retrovirus-related pol polyprotein LINE-1 [Tanacetum coccineum]
MSDRIMKIAVVIDGETFNVISAYAPHVGLSDTGDLNGHIGAAADGYAGVQGGFGFGARNEEGREILEFATAYDLVVANSFFKKSNAHLITFQSGGRNTQIDYLLVRRGDLRATTHEEGDRKAEDFVEEPEGGRDAAKDSVRVARESARTHSTHRESWWFSEEVQTKVAAKKSKFKELLSCREDAKARERKRRDLGNVRYIKDEARRTIIMEEDIRKRWGEYFSSLFNETSSDESRPEGSGEVVNSSPHMLFDCYYSRINQGEVRTELQKMGRNKFVGPDQIPIEAWRCLEDEGVKWLTDLFNKIFSSAKMPDEWRLSEVIPIYKNKGDAQACSNYRGIKLLSHTMKLWERVIERRLRRETGVSETQFGFMPERSTTEAIHLLKGLMEKYRDRQRDLHLAFLDVEKAYESVPRELIWRTLLAKGILRRYLRVILSHPHTGPGRNMCPGA